MLSLTNTLTDAQELFSPFDGNTVRMYACGPTVHDFAHIGNFRTYVFEDILRRHLESKGWKLFHVMNVTDVDDKTIRKALDQGVDIRTYSEKYTRAFFEDIERLRIEKPEIVAHATDHIDEMIELVRRLLVKGYAYAEGGSVYFRISSFPSYGRLSKLDRRQLRMGTRVDVDEYQKEEPRDFVLWKAPKDDREPRWEADFGVGRPGWHLECSAMAMKYLGATLDIHCGGVDLIFPHHENEIAQSEASTGVPFVRFWIHGEHLLFEGEKMAKSKGNVHVLRDLLDQGYDPVAIRYLLLSVPYGKKLNFTFDGLRQAGRAVERIKELRFRLGRAQLRAGANERLIDCVREARSELDRALDDDLNSAQALRAVFNLVRDANIALQEEAVEAANREEILGWFEEVDARLGILPSGALPPGTDSEIETLIAERNAARRQRDFALADEIRKRLAERNVIIEDTREGTQWRRR